MIRLLKYIGIYLWLTVLFAVPVSFYIILLLDRSGFIISPVITAMAVLALVGFSIGFLMDITAKKWIISLIREGQTWERSGLVEKARRKYITALRVYDTFLLFPFSVRKTAERISSVIAGFHLNHPDDNANFKLGTAAYLKMNPMDADMARLWLSRISQAHIVTSLEQDVLYTIARANMGDIRLLPLLTEIFLDLQRSDFVAKKIYQQVMAKPDLAKIYKSRICNLTDGQEDNLIRQASFSMPEPQMEKGTGITEDLFRYASGGLVTAKKVWIYIWRQLGSGLRCIFLSSGRLLVFIKTHEKFRFYLKAALSGIFLAGFVFFVISTLFHTFRTRALEQKETMQEKAVSKPFTIQVAAYLTLPRAQTYADSLKKNKIEATIKKVEGGGKTWFVISVSEFADKQSASEYGNKLKQQHLIDDFFVNNR